MQRISGMHFQKLKVFQNEIWQFTTGVPELSKPNIKTKGIDSTSILIPWENLFGADNYFLEYAFIEQGSFIQVYYGTDTTYIHSGLSKNQKLWYRVKAENNQFVSEWSDTISAVASGIPIEGLVAYYPFNGNADDESDNENHGTVNGPILIEGRFGTPDSAFTFDGVNDIISIPDASQLNPTQELTVSFWILIPDDLNHWGGIIEKGNDNKNSYAFNVIPDSTVICVGTAWPNTEDGYTYSIGVTENTWHHVALTFNNGMASFFVNGNLLNQESGKILNFAEGTLLFGLNEGADDEYGKFSLDDVRIYNRALSESETLQLVGFRFFLAV